MRYGYLPSSEASVDELRDRLYSCERFILERVAEPYNSILDSYYHVQDRVERGRWEYAIVEKILDNLEPYQGACRYGYGKVDRYRCPLCGYEGQQGIFTKEGIRRHMERDRECLPYCIAVNHSMDYFKRKYGEADALEDQAKRDVLLRRKEEETLYLVCPYEAPKLFDDLGFGEKVVSPELMEVREKALLEAGFEKREEKKILSYVYDKTEGNVFYADIRGTAFRIVEYEVKPKKGKHMDYRYAYAHSIQDKWKDLPGKIRKRLI